MSSEKRSTHADIGDLLTLLAGVVGLGEMDRRVRTMIAETAHQIVIDRAEQQVECVVVPLRRRR